MTKRNGTRGSGPQRPVLRMTQVREARGLSKAEVARRARLDQSLISKIESGREKPWPGQLARLARVLRVRGGVLMQEVRAV